MEDDPSIGMGRAAADPPPGPPAVSVIMPARNAAAFVAEAIASIRAQTFRDWEAIIVDDGSTDGTAAILEELARQDPRLVCIRLDAATGGTGAAAARNAALRRARGRYIAFLDADDLWYPQKLARQMALFRAGAGMVYASYRRIDAKGRHLADVRVPPSVTYAEALRGNPIGCLTAAYDTAVFGKVEMPPLRRRQDYALWLSLLRAQGAAIGDMQVLAAYRVHPGSLSSNKMKAAMATWHVLHKVEGLPILTASRYFWRYGLRALRRRL